VDLNTVQPDAVTFLRLALALDHQKKYPDAMVAANRAVELAGNDAAIREKAVQEQNRLKQLTGASSGATTPGGGVPRAAGTGTAPPSKPQQQQQPPR
jgi:hypothetical protein